MAARTTLFVVLILAMSGVLASTASAFMTWDTLGLGNAEHERITRLGIACNSTFSGPRDANLDWQSTCLDSLPPSCLSGAIKDLFNCNERNPGNRERTLRMLAGSPGYYGGVGAPDSIPEAISSQDASHCDNGDFFFGASTYPFGVDHRAQGLRDCAVRMNGYMDEAVQLAGLLVNGERVNAYETDLTEDCWTNFPRWRDNDFRAPAEAGNNTRTKCKVLMLVGRSFHIVEDAFSHGNWVDANPATPSTNDAPGLAQPIGTIPDMLRYPRTTDQINVFLAESQYITGAYGSNLDGRITHDQLKPVFSKSASRGLNKDEGSANIDWTTNTVPTGAGGHSLRATDGSIDGMDNFQRAARGAAYAAAQLWTDFRNAIYARYGRGAKGELIWRAIRESTPWTQCTIYGAAARAITAPVGTVSSARSFSMTIVNRTDQTFGCQSATLDGGEWASMPPDSIAPGGSYSFRTQSNGVMTGTEGSVNYPGLRIYWNNPYVGSNDYTCTATTAKCSITYSRGNDASMTLTLTPCSGACPRVARSETRTKDPTVTYAQVKALHRELGYDVNDAASRVEVKHLPRSVGKVRECTQLGTIDLHVEDMTCKEAVKWIRGYQFSTDEQWCPKGWSFIGNPKGHPAGTMLCLHDVAGGSIDGKREAFTIKLPHGIG
ncbi:MAG: hypothetical protein NTX95_00475 [Actinobacteria bacterium]|nr:hypothetical protein [Actinomycetota bacterium]